MQPVSGDAIPTTMRDLNPPASPPTPSNGTTSLSVSDDDIIHGFKKLLCEMDHLNKTQILENSGGIYFFIRDRDLYACTFSRLKILNYCVFISFSDLVNTSLNDHISNLQLGNLYIFHRLF